MPSVSRGRASTRGRILFLRWRSRSSVRPLALLTLANMPRNARAHAPVGRMLEWHQLKLVGGMLMAVLGFGPPGMSARLAAMPVTELEQILGTTDAFAEDADALERRGRCA